MSRSAWSALGDELFALDRWGDFDPAKRQFDAADPKTWLWRHADPHPVNILVNSDIPPDHVEFYAPALIGGLNTLRDEAGLEMVVRALTRKGLTAAVGPILKLFSLPSLLREQNCLWAAGNAIYWIAPKDHLEESLRICRDRRVGAARQRLIVHLCRFKKSPDVFDTLITLLEDETARGAAMESLRRFGDPRALPAIERTPVREGEEGIYETHQKERALKTLAAKSNKA